VLVKKTWRGVKRGAGGAEKEKVFVRENRSMNQALKKNTRQLEGENRGYYGEKRGRRKKDTGEERRNDK